jgi:hypothetical protein
LVTPQGNECSREFGRQGKDLCCSCSVALMDARRTSLNDGANVFSSPEAAPLPTAVACRCGPSSRKKFPAQTCVLPATRLIRALPHATRSRRHVGNARRSDHRAARSRLRLPAARSLPARELALAALRDANAHQRPQVRRTGTRRCRPRINRTGRGMRNHRRSSTFGARREDGSRRNEGSAGDAGGRYTRRIGRRASDSIGCEQTIG